MMNHQQHQYIQLVPSSSSSPAANDADEARRLVDMCPSLYRALHRGRTEEVMALLLRKHGAALTDHQATGITIHGQCDILEVTAERNTVLHLAAEQGHDELIQELYLRFREQCLLSRRNSALDTPLHCAARAGRDKAVEVLIKLAQDCGESILGCKNEAGDTALHMAARHGHGATAEVLVSAAAGIAADLNNAGVSPLYLAVMSGSVRAVRTITTCKDASSIGPSSQNALHAAVFQSSEMVRLLLDWNPALADQVDSNGSSPLHFASSVGDRDIVRAILRAAPPRTLYRKDSCGGLSALHVAARMGHRRVVEDMLGTCPDAAELRDDDGGTFLHAATREKRHTVVSLAVGNPMLRGLLDARDRDGNTPLHVAAAASAPRVVEALLRKGKVRADVLNDGGRRSRRGVAGRLLHHGEPRGDAGRVRGPAPAAEGGPSEARERRRRRRCGAVDREDVRQPRCGGGADRHRRVRRRVQHARRVRRRRRGEPRGQGHVQDLPVPGHGGRGDVGDRGGPARLRQGVALRRLVEELRVGAAVHVGVADEPDAGILRGSCRGDAHKGSLPVLVGSHLREHQCLEHLHHGMGRAGEEVVHTTWRFLWRSRRPKGKHVIIQRQYPVAGASVLNFFLFTTISILALIGLQVIFRLYGSQGQGQGISLSPAPSPL